jgi:mannosyltransferase OCH1-like enzyme
MNKIPRIIHQTWKDDNIPPHYVPWVESWKQNHPEWKFQLWTDEMNMNFIEKNACNFLDIYKSYPHTIQRVDAVRYFILYHFGGVFVDLDFECLENIEALLKDEECVFGIEPSDHCERFKKDLIVCNAFMACKPRNEFFRLICNELEANSSHKNGAVPVWREILESTGPFKLTEIYNNYEDKNKIKLIPPELIYPFSLDEIRELINTENIDEEAQKKINRAYAVHYFLGSWW